VIRPTTPQGNTLTSKFKWLVNGSNHFADLDSEAFFSSSIRSSNQTPILSVGAKSRRDQVKSTASP